MIFILKEMIHAFLSIVLHNYHERTDPCDLSFFYENHSKEKYHSRKTKDSDSLCVYIIVFSECTV
jgi:hypothetical protein